MTLRNFVQIRIHIVRIAPRWWWKAHPVIALQGGHRHARDCSHPWTVQRRTIVPGAIQAGYSRSPVLRCGQHRHGGPECRHRNRVGIWGRPDCGSCYAGRRSISVRRLAIHAGARDRCGCFSCSGPCRRPSCGQGTCFACRAFRGFGRDHRMVRGTPRRCGRIAPVAWTRSASPVSVRSGWRSASPFIAAMSLTAPPGRPLFCVRSRIAPRSRLRSASVRGGLRSSSRPAHRPTPRTIPLLL